MKQNNGEPTQVLLKILHDAAGGVVSTKLDELFREKMAQLEQEISRKGFEYLITKLYTDGLIDKKERKGGYFITSKGQRIRETKG